MAGLPIAFSRDPLMLVFRPPVLELLTGTALVALGFLQAVAEPVPSPAGDPIIALLTALGVGGVVSWSAKQLIGWHIKRMEMDRAELVKKQQEEREQDRLDREHQREENRRLQEQINQMVVFHQEEAKFWRDTALGFRAPKPPEPPHPS